MSDPQSLKQLVELLEGELLLRTGSRASGVTDDALRAAIRDARRAALAFADGQPAKGRAIVEQAPQRTLDTWSMVAINFVGATDER